MHRKKYVANTIFKTFFIIWTRRYSLQRRPTFSYYKELWPNLLKTLAPVHMFVCLSVCVFTFEVLFKRLLAPTSISWMSNIFRDSKSLGRSNGKKWSQNWKNTNKGCKMAAYFFSGEFRLTKSIIIKSIKSRFANFRIYLKTKSLKSTRFRVLGGRGQTDRHTVTVLSHRLT